MAAVDRPLRIALLAYRGKPHCGGQGIYVRHLSTALADLGHHVEVLGGQPYPVLDDRVPLVELPSLDIYNEHFPMRMPGLWELKNWKDYAEVMAFSAGTFPEPLAFSLRAWDHLRHRKDDFDIVHDNQSLGYGLL
ncbi:MAG TPA: glycosyltransferase, partial [Acidimicrobiales bacterium]